jgi:hypothetical protein
MESGVPSRREEMCEDWYMEAGEVRVDRKPTGLDKEWDLVFATLRAAREMCEELVAENERLRSALEKIASNCCEHTPLEEIACAALTPRTHGGGGYAGKLEAEIKRLRGALEKIADHGDTGWEASLCAMVARAALFGGLTPRNSSPTDDHSKA